MAVNVAVKKANLVAVKGPQVAVVFARSGSKARRDLATLILVRQLRKCIHNNCVSQT